MKKSKTAKQIERHLKGVANHWRIEILLFVAAQSGATVDEIARGVGGHFKTISEHARRLVQAGLVDKQYKGRTVVHTLSPYSRIFCVFIRTFQHS